MKLKNFGAISSDELKPENLSELKIETGKRIFASAESAEGSEHDKAGKPLEQKNCFSNFGVECKASAGGNSRQLKINGIKHPNIFNSKKRYGFTLGEDTEIVSEDVNLSPLAGSKIASADVNLSPLRGKYPPEAGERGLMKRGFTLAEVLITLVVIGVVAAITIPVLHSNTQGKEWNAAKQKARAGMGEAFKLMSVNGELENYPNGGEDVVKYVLPKYLKLAKTCTGENAPTDCGFPKTFKTPAGNTVDSSNLKNWSTWLGTAYLRKNKVLSPSGEAWKAGFFQTLDGFSAALFYNPDCSSSNADNAAEFSLDDSLYVDYAFPAACFNAVYDMNGAKGPNRAGYDIGFAGSFYTGAAAQSAAVLPVDNDAETDLNFYDASALCKKLGTDYDLPSIEELSLIYLNNKAVGNNTTDGLSSRYWSRSAYSASNSMRHIYMNEGRRTSNSKNMPMKVRCVRADKLM